MELRDKFIIKALLGTVLGMIIGIIMWLIYGGSLSGADRTQFIVHLIGSALLGFIAMGSSVVYEIESWGILRPTVLHYILCMVTFYIDATLLGWFSGDSILIAILIMTVIYAIIWVCESLYWKKTIESVNEQLRNLDKKTV
ncbi:MAG: DUF3021 domain-containing protein [Lachnospiraceae bacterium]|nr:DUF3021 domain-containing protein [Lachnospiraceae bacterium]